MSRAEVSKLVQHVALGPPADTASVSKLVMYVLLVPGLDPGTEEPDRQAHVHIQKITRN
jgi:hypothetical protein